MIVESRCMSFLRNISLHHLIGMIGLVLSKIEFSSIETILTEVRGWDTERYPILGLMIREVS
jgi:hypothetical protein